MPIHVPSVVFCSRLDRPVGGLFILSVTLGRQQADAVGAELRALLISEYNKSGRNAALPLVDLDDGRSLIRYISVVRPTLVDTAGRRIFVEPPPASIVRVQADYLPMRSCAGLMPVMHRVVVLEMAGEVAA